MLHQLCHFCLVISLLISLRPLTAHFFSNFYFLLHIKPWSQTPFLVCHICKHAPLCFVSLLPHCSSQVRQKLCSFVELRSSNSSLTTKEVMHLSGQAVLFSKECCSYHFTQIKGLQTSAYFPPLIIMVYTETEGVFASCRRPKGASGSRQLAQCSTPSEPFPTAYITEGMSNHTSPSIYSWLLSRMVTCAYQYLHWPDFTTTKGPLHHWAF